MSEEVKENTVELKGEFVTSIDGDVATLKYKDENAFFDTTELSKKQIKEVFKHADSYIEAATTKASEAATALMSKEKGVNVVNAELPYGVSKLGAVNVQAKRSHTYPGINGNEPVTKSTLKVVVKDPLTKLSKPKVRALEAAMTKKLLG